MIVDVRVPLATTVMGRFDIMDSIALTMNKTAVLYLR